MKSQANADSWACYGALSAEAQTRADKAYVLFRQNPSHPSLRFKRLEGRANYYSVRVSDGLRAVGIRDGDTMVWFWIGTHNEFDKLF